MRRRAGKGSPRFPIGVRLPTAISIAVVGLCCAWTAVQPPVPAYFVINESQSLPRGLYRRASAPIRRGDIVAVTPPPAAKAYLQDLGATSDVRLLKRVAAIDGDQVCTGVRRLEFGAVILAVADLDQQGRLLPAWRDCRRLGPDELLVVGDSLESFDSRYFGPVRWSDVTGPYVEAILW